jgi:tripartite-type tricarboxylate transporter receptor subunit TctC
VHRRIARRRRLSSRRLTAAINAVLPKPDVQEKAKSLGMAMRPSTPDEMTARMKDDIAKWGAVIEKAGIPKRD